MTTELFAADIPAYAIDTVSERVEKVNRRANRRGFPAVTLTLGRKFMQPDPYFEHVCYGGCDCTIPDVEYVHASLHASGPLSLNGWRLVGVIAPVDGGDGFLTSDVPGESTRGIVVTDPFGCEHCNMRRMRSETFLLRHDDGTTRQVGRQCIRDFLGHDPAALLRGLDAWNSLILSDDEVRAWGMAAPRTFRVSDVLSIAAHVVAVDGWYISKAKAIESAENDDAVTLISTASTVGNLLIGGNTKYDRELREKYLGDNPFADEILALTLREIEEINPNTDNEWQYKVRQYAAVDAVQMRHVGVLASAVSMGLRKHERVQRERAEREARLAARAGMREPGFVGTVGGKVEIPTATVTLFRYMENSLYGSWLVKFETPEGDTLTWFASNPPEGLDAGVTVALTGTVKKHDTYRDQPSTVLTRCKVTIL